MRLRSFNLYLMGFCLLFVVSVLCHQTTFAHVTLLEPTGGETLEGDSAFTIKWDVDEEVAPEENWDIRFSRDNGQNWDVVTTNLLFTTREFNWPVPNINTTQGRIEVIEDFPDGEDEGARSPAFTITRTNTKAFTFNCETAFEDGPRGLEMLVMRLGEEQSCILKLTNPDPDKPMEVFTKIRKGSRPPIEVAPVNETINDNGELEFIVRATDTGITWVAWAISDTETGRKFTRETYRNNTAWGLFIDVVE